MITPAWTERRELLVVGAGAAGMTAATLAAGLGIDTLLLDEQPAAGGRTWRGVDHAPARAAALGETAERALARLQRLAASAAEFRAASSVFSLDAGRLARVGDGAGGYAVAAERVILATGAVERPLLVPGWTLPGVVPAGGAASLLVESGLVPAAGADGMADVVLAGGGLLPFELASLYLRAGVTPRAVLSTTPLTSLRRALAHLPAALLAGAGLREALARLRALRAAGVRIRFGVRELRAVGEGRVQAVEYRRRRRWRSIPAGLLLAHRDKVPDSLLARAAGLRHFWDDRGECLRPALEEHGASSVPGIAVAGGAAHADSTAMAAAEGALAALDAARALGRLDAAEARRLADPHRRVLESERRLQALRKLLGTAVGPLAVPEDDEVVVCRCRGVTAGVVRAAAGERLDTAGVARRAGCGDGACGGRLCEAVLVRLAADMSGVKPREVGALPVTAPVCPVPEATLRAFEAAGDVTQPPLASGG